MLWKLRHRLGLATPPESAGEKDASWYDHAFEENPRAHQHYSKSPYYFLWTVIADRLLRANTQHVLEIGCGAGQFARLLSDKGIPAYHGFDFSPARIEHATNSNPSFSFTVEDAFETDLFTTLGYDAAVSTEFLEHIERDLDVLSYLRTGTRFVGTVPNFPYPSHVRHFDSEEEVRHRYSQRFDEFSVVAFLGNDNGKTFYILDGIVR